MNQSAPVIIAIALVVGCDRTPVMQFETSVDPSGCLLEQVAVAPGVNQYQYDSLSPDGGVIAIAWDRGEERGTYLLNLKTGERTDLPALNNGAVFSPDGKTLVNSIYVENEKTDIAEYDIAGASMTVIASHEEWDWLASYSSDGGTILFNSFRSGGSDIYTYRKIDGELKRWTDFDGYEAHGQYSPDDSRILFHRLQGEGNFDVFVIEVANGDITPLTNEPTEESYASWSPDGKTIAFASDRNQEPEFTDIFLMGRNGGKARPLTDHPAKDAYPFFSPDGKHLYFTSDREPQGVYRLALDQNLDCEKG